MCQRNLKENQARKKELPPHLQHILNGLVENVRTAVLKHYSFVELVELAEPKGPSAQRSASVIRAMIDDLQIGSASCVPANCRVQNGAAREEDTVYSPERQEIYVRPTLVFGNKESEAA